MAQSLTPSRPSNRAIRGFWLICFFVCPLLFFTDLTRNPYITQAILLNLSLLAVVALCAIEGSFKGQWSFPATPLDMPLGAWAAVCGVSWLWAYFHHAAFFDGSIRAEGLKNTAFVLVGTFLPFYMGAHCAREGGSPEGRDFAAKRWGIFFLVWGGLWALFPGLRGSASSLSLDGHFWDTYGGLLWISGIWMLWILARGGSVHEFWQVSLGVAFLGAAYGILQYFNVDWIWPKLLNPYGGRSVSTFGNPNFMSSYMVVLLPLAVLYYLKARQASSRLIYAIVCLVMEGSLLASLTRSSWFGALVGLGLLFLSKNVRNLVRENSVTHKFVLAVAILVAILWPHTSVQSSTPTVLGRIIELSSIFDTKSAEPYSPFYQRVLIWASAWMMGKENPLLGKGWGLFDMFYPFYQGPLLAHYDFFRTMRTHGNNAHNEILEVWAQTGLIGVGVLFWIWTTYFVSVRRWIKSGSGSEWIIASAAGVAGMLADCMLNVSLHFAVPAFIFWWQAGVSMGLASPGGNNRRRLSFQGRRGAALVGALAIILSCGCAGWWWVCQWNRDVRYFLGFKLFHSGQLTAAVDMLESAYRWNGRDVNADYELGNAYARAERFDRAVWAYHEALNSNAGYDEIYFNTGAVLAQHLGRPEEAIAFFQIANLINPLSVGVYTGLAALYIKDPAHYRESAIPLLERAIHYFPDNPAFLANLGYLYGLDHKEAQALDLWIRALRINPDLTIAEHNLTVLLSKGGKTHDSILADLSLFHDLEARIARRDYSSETLEEARKAAAAFPLCPKPQFFVGTLDMANGKNEEAVRLLEPLAQGDTTNASLFENLGEAYLKLGRSEDAVEAFRRALQLDPNNAAVRQRLSSIGQHQ